MAQLPVETPSVVALISAFAAGCFCGYFRWRWFAACIAFLWTVLSLVFPEFSFFWPLVAYDIAYRRLYPALALPIVCLVLNLGYLGGSVFAFSVFGAAAAVFICLRSDNTEKYSRDIRHIRDDAMEANLLLNRRNMELKKAQDYEIRIATLTERGRIAREIHDNVGHMLSRAMLQTGAMIATSKDSTAKDGLSSLNETLTLAMNSVRESVHDLRDESFDLRGMIYGCVNDFSKYECNINYNISANTPNGIQYCFAAVIREAFANVERHSSATRIRIDLLEHPTFYKLLFADNGKQRADVRAGSETGMGLENMRERAQSLGGQMQVRQDKGFSIHIIIPKDGGRI